ncbi:hypothetical protein P3W45_001031 [Vairimorpha bombi]
MRLVLESIAMKNFKSYKGIHNIQNIDKSFTAIVGPNGSGKSNIIDSILFVLGFRAKKMRHTQLTDLIYNDGTKEKSCFVELTFNKFKIKREINVNKSTKYYCDGKEISNSDLITKMMEEGVDMEHNRFLILQGEIEGIAMLKPKEGLLEFLEDIIGTSKYKTQIDEFNEEAKAMEENNITIQNNVKFLKTEFDHISELKKQNEEVLINKTKHNEYFKEFKTINKEILSRNLHKKEEKKKEIEKKIGELKNLNSENKNLLESMELEHNSIRKLLKDKEEEYFIIKREYKKLDRNNYIQKELKNKLEKQIKNMKSDLNSIKSKSEMKTRENKILIKELSDNENELEKLNKSRLKIKNQLDEEQKKISVKCTSDMKKLKENEDKLISLLNKKSEQNQKNAQSNMEIKYKEEQESSITNEIINLKNKLKNFENVKHLNKDQIQKELRELEIDIDKTQSELQKRKTRYNEVYQREENDKKEKEIFNYLSDIKGVVGRLKDIGEVEPKYELPLKISCTRLNNIVVDTTQTAEKCIEIVKKNNLPRSTFIILDKIQEMPKLENQSLPYMFEFVNCDKKYKKCFYFSLTDTLLADNLDKAQNHAFGKARKRVVTLDGKLIEKSGIMTGGKYHEKVKKYEDIEKAMNKMTALKEQKLKDLNLISEYENQVNIRKALNEKEGLLKEIKDKISSLQSSVRVISYEDEIANVKEDINKCKSKLEKYYNTSLSGKLQILNEKIEILEGRNHEIKITLSEKIDSYEEIEKEVEKKTEELSKIDIKDLTTLKNNLDREEDLYNELSNDFKAIQENLASLKKKMGKEYHLEIDLNNQLDDLSESINDISRNIDNEIENIKLISEKILENYKILNIKNKDEENLLLDDLKNLSDNDLEDFKKKLEKKIKKLSEESDKKEVDLVIFEEYEKSKEAYTKAKNEYDIQICKYENKKNEAERLKKKRYDEFTEGLSKVNSYLKEIYKKLTFGGNAELELIDYLDPFSDGIRLAVMPPKKCWKNVSNLSGGEKTLSSLSLIFALHKFKPSPFYVMDEIDAALDFRNVGIISGYIKEMAKSSQFIVISLRNDMFEISNSILGVYKVNNISKLLMINVDEIKKKLLTS